MYIKDTLHNIKFYSLFIILSIILSSCSKENYEAQLPTYISIDQITVTTDLATQGSSTSNITDAWVYVDDNLVGVFELPATFPVLKEGNVTMKVYAGIKDNGISSTRARYLLYDPHIEQLNLVKGETIKVNPNVTYASGAIFPWIEDFENPSLSFLYTTDSDTIINKQSTDVRDGVFSGQVYLDTGMDFFEATSIAFTTIPRNGRPVYFELDFKTNQELLIGIYLDTGKALYIVLKETSEWKKVYINLTGIINSLASSSEVKIFIGYDVLANPFTATNPEIHLDNLKLVHL
ncbi:MAG: hypothetical protein JKX68_08740 [Flavobacteriales bacterium]|nr:hypothetical protein [Flavobacteriales bacterium]